MFKVKTGYVRLRSLVGAAGARSIILWREDRLEGSNLAPTYGFLGRMKWLTNNERAYYHPVARDMEDPLLLFILFYELPTA